MVTTDTGGGVLDESFVNTARRGDGLAYLQGRSNKGLQIKT